MNAVPLDGQCPLHYTEDSAEIRVKIANPNFSPPPRETKNKPTCIIVLNVISYLFCELEVQNEENVRFDFSLGLTRHFMFRLRTEP